jgi:hypothetical protein
MKLTKPILLYTPSADMTAAVLNRIAKAGYLAVPVASMDAVKIIDTIPQPTIGPEARAAFDAIAASGGTLVAEDFGRRVAKSLGTQPAAK